MFAGPNPFEKIQTSAGTTGGGHSLFGNFGQAMTTQFGETQETNSLSQTLQASLPTTNSLHIAAAAIAPSLTAEAVGGRSGLLAQEEDIPSAGGRPSASSFGAGGHQYVTIQDMNAVFNQQQSPIRLSSSALGQDLSGNVESISAVANDGASDQKAVPGLRHPLTGTGGFFGGGGTSQNTNMNDSSSHLDSDIGGSGVPSTTPGGMIRFHTSHSQPPGSFIKMAGGAKSPSHLSALGGGVNGSVWKGSHPGELVPHRNFTYHSIGELETLVPEHQTLSLDISSSSGKLYRVSKKSDGGTLLALQSPSGDNDLQLLINQQDLFRNLVAPFKQIQAPVTSDQAGIAALTGAIVDFAVLKGRRLFLLYQTQITVLDISEIVKSSQKGSSKTSVFDTQPQYLDQIPLPSDCQYNTLDALSINQDGNATDILVLSHRNQAAVTIYYSKVSDSVWEDFTLKLDESKVIRDLNFSGHLMSVLLDRNEVQVIYLLTRAVVFKSQFKDASGKVSRLFYLDPNKIYPRRGQRFKEDGSESSSGESQHQDFSSRFKDDTVVGEDEDEEEGMQKDISELRMRPKRLPLFQIATRKLEDNKPIYPTFSGFFLFFETQKSKDSNSSKTRSHFEKISIAKIIVRQGVNTHMEQRLQQIDSIKISDKTKKNIEFDEQRGLVFLMNQKSSNLGITGQQSLKLYTIKLKRIYSQLPHGGGSDSEDTQTTPGIDDKTRVSTGMKFGFIKGLHLQMNSTAQHKILTSKSKSAKKLKFFKAIFQTDNLSPQRQIYFTYSAIADQILVHELDYSSISEKLEQEPPASMSPFMNLQPLQINGGLTQPPAAGGIGLGRYSTLSTGGGSFNYDHHQSSSIFGLDPFSANAANQPDDNEEDEKQDQLPTPFLGAQVPPFGIISISDQERHRVRTKIGENQVPTLDDDQCALLQELLYKASGGLPTDKLIFEDQGEDFDGDVACFNSDALAPTQTDDMEEVKRELNEAIQKDMELPSIINAHDEFFYQNHDQSAAEDVLYGNSRSPRSVEESEPAKEAPKPEKAGKEIVLNAEQFKMIHQSKQQQVQAPAAGDKKKKKKPKNKAQGQGVTTPTNFVTSIQQESQPKKDSPVIPQRVLPTHASASQLAFTVVGQQSNAPLYQQKQTPQEKYPAQLQKPQPLAQPQKKQAKGEKSQEELLLENLGDLTKKYQELAQKFGKLQDQLLNVAQQQPELERCISKNIQQIVPSMIEQQMRERIVPSVLAHLKGIDKVVKDELMPQVELQMQDVITKLIKQNKIKVLRDDEEEKKAEEGRKSEQQIQEIIDKAVVVQFAQAMDTQVKPVLEASFKTIIEQVQRGLEGVNEEFNRRLKEEEQRNKELLEALSRQEVVQQDPHGSNYSSYHAHYPQQQAFGGYPPYPYYHPHHAYYPPPPSLYPPSYFPQRPPYPGHFPVGAFPYHHMEQPPLSAYPSTTGPMPATAQPVSQDGRLYQTSATTSTLSANISPIHPYSQNSLSSQALAQNQSQNTATFLSTERQLSNYTQPQMASSQIKPAANTKSTLHSDLDYPGNPLAPPHQSQPHWSQALEEVKLGEPVPKPQQLPLQANAKAKSTSSNSSMTCTPTNRQGGEMVESPKKKLKQQQSAAQSEIKLLDGPQIGATDYTKKKWGLIPYMKEVATQGKATQADFLLCGSDLFLQEAVQFVRENSHIITNQYTTKIIHQFIKKVYRRAKDNDKARKGALAILNVFIEKIYRVRENMKQLVCQANQWEAEIKALVEGDDE